MTYPLDLVLHLQFATLELHDSHIINRWMGQAFGDFVFERLMFSLQFRKVRLHRHAVCLLNQWLSLQFKYSADSAQARRYIRVRSAANRRKPLIGVDFLTLERPCGKRNNCRAFAETIRPSASSGGND
jgi:hypothetical protein